MVLNTHPKTMQTLAGLSQIRNQAPLCRDAATTHLNAVDILLLVLHKIHRRRT
jgi:hypothetical protein